MFSKPHRLRKTADIQATFSRGRGFFNRYFSLKFRKNSTISRFTVVVSTKVSKRSVVRNRLKRITREQLKKALSFLPSGDYVVSLKAPAARDEESAVLTELSRLLQQIK